MNRKQFSILLVLVLVIGGLGIAAYRHNSESWESNASAGGRVLGKFALNDVTQVSIKDSHSAVTLAKKGDAWVVADRGDYPADFARIGNFIQGLWELKPLQDVKVGPSQLGRLDLVAPEPDKKEAKDAKNAKESAHTGTLVELKGDGGKSIAALLLGKKSFSKSSGGFGGGEGFANGRYVMPVGPANAPVSLVSETLENAEPKPQEWLDKTFLRIDGIASVTVDRPAEGKTPAIQWTLSRKDDKALDWKLADAKPDEKLDSAKLPSFPAILGSPGFTDVKAIKEPAGNGGKVTVRTFDHFTYVLNFGKPEGENLPLAFTVSADLPKERTPGKAEKPEEKKKLDDEFAAKNKKLEEKLKKEKGLEGRVYLVSKTSFEPLFKSRADLLEVKKASPTPSPSPASSPAASAVPSPSAAKVAAAVKKK